MASYLQTLQSEAGCPLHSYVTVLQDLDIINHRLDRGIKAHKLPIQHKNNYIKRLYSSFEYIFGLLLPLIRYNSNDMTRSEMGKDLEMTSDQNQTQVLEFMVLANYTTPPRDYSNLFLLISLFKFTYLIQRQYIALMTKMNKLLYPLIRV